MYGALKYVTIITLEAIQYAGCYWRRVAHVLLNRPTDASLMNLNRTPLVLLIIAVLLEGVVYLQEQTTPPPVTSEAQLLFGFQEADVRSLSLKTPEQNLSFVKNAAPNPATWQMTSPN